MEFELISANYNNGKYLDTFFESLIHSTVRPFKVIIVDDASTDNSVDIINSYKDRLNIQLYCNKDNKGFANSLNIALGLVSQPFVARLDPDDFVHPERFSKQLSFLKMNQEIDLVGTNVRYVLNGENKKDSDVPLSEESIKQFIKDGILPVIHGSIMTRAAAIKAFTYKQECVPAEDYDLFAYYISNNKRIANIEEALTYVTIHANSVSNELKYKTVSMRYVLASQYFNLRKSPIAIWSEFNHLKYYRKFLFEDGIKRFGYIILASSFKPFKSIKKAIRMLGKKALGA